ncbi:MAG TPA: saccharopine dehydrogenase NADP-binding domain-containing protein [Actinomycetota bacterium]
MEGSVVVLGGYGQTGRRIAGPLAARTSLPIVVAGRNGDRAAAVAERLCRLRNGAPVEARSVDAAEPKRLRDLVAGARLLVDATSSEVPVDSIARTALEAGVDLVEVRFPSPGPGDLVGIEAEAVAADRCIVLQAGFHPGVPAALVRWAGARVDELESAWVAGLLRQRGGIPLTPAVDDLIQSFRHYRAHVFCDGSWRKARWWDPGSFPRVNFDFDFGLRRTSPMDLDELRDLPVWFPSLRRLGFSVAGFDPVTDWLIAPAVVAALPLFGSRSVRPLSRMLCWSTRTFGRPPCGVVVQLHARGRRAGTPVHLALSMLHADGYALTAIPVVSMIEQLLDGTARRPGVHLMGLLTDPDRLLADVAAMGVKVRLRGPVEESRVG